MIKTIFIDTNILCKCWEYHEMLNKLSRDKHLSKNRFVTTDVFLKEFKSYIYEKTQSRMAASYTNHIKDLFDEIIDCK